MGAGTMGASIAYLMAFNGYEVHLVDINDEMLNRGKMNWKRPTLKKWIDLFLEKKEKRRVQGKTLVLSLGNREASLILFNPRMT